MSLNFHKWQLDFYNEEDTSELILFPAKVYRQKASAECINILFNPFHITTDMYRLDTGLSSPNARHCKLN
jgi:hypothetical protein